MWRVREYLPLGTHNPFYKAPVMSCHSFGSASQLRIAWQLLAGLVQYPYLMTHIHLATRLHG